MAEMQCPHRAAFRCESMSQIFFRLVNSHCASVCRTILDFVSLSPCEELISHSGREGEHETLVLSGLPARLWGLKAAEVQYCF